MRRIGRNSILCCALGWMIFSSCDKKEIVLETTNDPVFVTSGEINGEAFTIVAGDNGAYMNTMTLMENGVQVFSGEMSGENLSLELGIYDGNLDMPTQNLIGELINFNPTFSMGYTGDYVTLSKHKYCTQTNSQNIEKIEWFVDGVKKGINDAVISEPGIYNVCARIKYYGSSVIEDLCNEMIVGYRRAENCSISFVMSQDSIVEASIESFGAPVTEVKWFMDGDQVSTDHTFDSILADDNLHKLTAEVHMGDVVRTKTVIIDKLGRTANDFTFLEELSSPSSRDFDLRLKIVQDGTVLVSETTDNLDASIEITGFEYYEKNSSGNDVYKITANVHANVQEVVSENIIPVSFTTTFGVEIK
ncbi:MAG: hypothetical protein QNK23_14750 [Crocinitomicaceae bacterium]|nr:hypothetical protein [Crocinitomicaceae bacterium]